MTVDIRDHRVAVADGLELHVREWAPETPRGASVVCLPGLSRPLDDFLALADFLSTADGGARRVVAISARGRGLSDRDPDPRRYQVSVEAGDVIAALAALGVARAAFIGTSRGGLQTMTIAAFKPDLVHAVVLNDIGPEIESAGLAHIRDMLADPYRPASFEDAAERLRRTNGARFPDLTDEDYARWARRAWRETDDGFVPSHDPNLVRIFDGIDLSQPIPPLWPLFDTLKDKPLMVVRGEFSDVLGADQLGRIVERRPDATTCLVPRQGHAPLLDDRPTMRAIADFLERAGG